MSGNTAEDKEGEPHLLVDPTSIKTEHSGKRIYTCPKCKHTTKHRTGMFRHRKYCEQNLTNQCKVCDKKFADNYSLKQHHKVKHEEGLVCPHCSKTFRSRQGLDYHLKTAVGEFKYKCEKCEKTFVSKQHFNGHMNTHKNTNCRPYECKDCNKYFAYKSTLEVHIDSCHNKKEYKCTTCDMVFFSKSSLTNHREGKHGEKVRRCEVCWKQFKWAASYYRHIKIHNE